jgi:hypothetical protein
VESINAAVEDWKLLRTFFPQDWKELARQNQALKGLRKDKNEENYLRVLLMHFGCGFSMRETVTRARQAKLAELSDVALLKRLRKSKDWLFSLCHALFKERGLQAQAPGSAKQLRLLDATLVKEPGKTGSLWRIHYSLQWPTLQCDYFKLTPTRGAGSAECLQQHPLARGDHIIADRGYCHADGIHYAAGKGALIAVRHNPHAVRLLKEKEEMFPLLEMLQTVTAAGGMAEWKVWIPAAGAKPLAARLCVIRKNETAIALALKKIRRKARGRKEKLTPETLAYTQYVMVLTTFPEDEFSTQAVLEHYRFRWQIELIFKRFKQIAQLGHLPKYDSESAKAWLYGKLFVALLTEKLIHRARSFSPWG